MSTTDRRISLFVVMVVIAMLAGGVGAAFHVPPPLPRIGWWPATGFPVGPKFDPSQVQTMTEVPIDVDWLDCGTGDVAGLEAASLLPPQVRYTRTAVIITMRLNDPTGILNACVRSGHYEIILDVGLPVTVHLDSPLGGRTLLDGSTDPPQAPVYI
jgi:hypothetical protein